MTNWGKNHITEICDFCNFGHPNAIILFTEDKAIYRKFKELPQCIEDFPYFSYMDRSKFLAADLYFPKHYKRNLTNRLKRLRIINEEK